MEIGPNGNRLKSFYRGAVMGNENVNIRSVTIEGLVCGSSEIGSVSAVYPGGPKSINGNL